MLSSDPLLAWHEQVEQTLLIWRQGARLARRYLRSPQGAVYTRVVADELVRLQRHSTMRQLMLDYGRTVTAWRPLKIPEGISRGVVEDVPYWLRLQQLVGRERYTRRAGGTGRPSRQ